MKHKYLIPLLLITFGALAAPSFASTTETTLSVKQMDCATCPVVVRAALYDLDGVDEVAVSMDDKTATVKYDDESLTASELAKAVTNAGFPAVVKE